MKKNDKESLVFQVGGAESPAKVLLGLLERLRGGAAKKVNKELLATVDKPLEKKKSYIQVRGPDLLEYCGGEAKLKSQFKYAEDAWNFLTDKFNELVLKLLKSYEEVGDLDFTDLSEWVYEKFASKATKTYLYSKFPGFKKEMEELSKKYIAAGSDRSKEGKAIEKLVLKKVKVQLTKVDRTNDWGDDPFYISDAILGIKN